MPLPREETTPPVTKIYLGSTLKVTYGIISNRKVSKNLPMPVPEIAAHAGHPLKKPQIMADAAKKSRAPTNNRPARSVDNLT